MVLEWIEKLKEGEYDFLRTMSSHNYQHLIATIRNLENKNILIDLFLEKLQNINPDFCFEIIYDNDNYGEVVQKMLNNKVLDERQLIDILIKTKWGKNFFFPVLNEYLPNLQNNNLGELFGHILNNWENWQDYVTYFRDNANPRIKYLFMQHILKNRQDLYQQIYPNSKIKNIILDQNKKSFLDIDYENEEIFNFWIPSNNDILSKLKEDELEEFLYYLNVYYLQFQKRLNIDDNITFGLEIEFENADLKQIIRSLPENFSKDGWILNLYDASLNDGAEIDSPILTNQPKEWQDLQKICKIIDSYAIIGLNSAGHIHVGTQVLGKERTSWLNFIKLWSAYENVIFRFLYGEFLSGRRKIKHFAAPLQQVFLNDYEIFNEINFSTFEIARWLSHNRNQAVNFNNISKLESFSEGNTIEFRCPNGTLNPIIWQNNVNFLIKLLLYCKSPQFDDDIVIKRFKANEDKQINLNNYNYIYLEQALELSDLLFTNNWDKIYFLRQYLKSFQIENCQLEKSAVFTRKL